MACISQKEGVKIAQERAMDEEGILMLFNLLGGDVHVIAYFQIK